MCIEVARSLGGCLPEVYTLIPILRFEFIKVKYRCLCLWKQKLLEQNSNLFIFTSKKCARTKTVTEQNNAHQVNKVHTSSLNEESSSYK